MTYVAIFLLLLMGTTKNQVFIFIGLSYLVFYIFIKVKKMFNDLSVEEVVLISILSSIAGVTRVPFSSIPSFQPTTSIIIIVGIVYGRKIGFITGAISALVSNMFLGQGPWTPWQMVAWGMCGYVASYLNVKNKHTIYIYGLVSGILFGWFMNLWHIIGFVEVINMHSILLSYVSSFAFDVTHGVGNVIFLGFLMPTLYKFLNRIKVKYNILAVS
ncbi:ECF transporter S component [Romboutsia weinsteinii]|uniref:ECF transporter S component n=1 Tax=Romboutsia weinsteinii TaxID=2020949 RepID=A0A371J595_9FIRM|nr:ECF transporter S component [Romboutsia weinsteinii]RDY27864.1 ECF transporter S component [Romboutsia weinsteinii]